MLLYYNVSSRERVRRETLTKVIKASRGESTVKKYDHAIAAWKVWCRLNRVQQEQADHEDVARYFIDMHNDKVPYSTIESAFYGIKWSYDCSPKLCSHNPCDTIIPDFCASYWKVSRGYPLHRFPGKNRLPQKFCVI